VPAYEFRVAKQCRCGPGLCHTGATVANVSLNLCAMTAWEFASEDADACEASSERFDAGGVVRLYGQRGCVLILAGVARPTGADPRNQVFSNPHLAAAFWWLFQQTATPKGVTTRK
jgi:hypothetical protein